jgi:predicted ATPase
MLKRIKILQEHRSLPAGLEIEFRPGVNLIVGDQGCGKTTLLNLIDSARREKDLRSARIELTVEGVAAFDSFDFERDNPRTATAFGRSDFGAQVDALFASHGQSMSLILSKLVAPKKVATTFLLDEPDMALSIRSIRAVEKFLKRAGAVGHQIVASVHNALMILPFEEVYSLEHKRWVKSKDFVDHHWLDKELK